MFIIPIERNNPNVNIAITTIAIEILNVLIFIVLYYFLNFEKIVMLFGFTPSKFEIDTLFTSMFLHAGIWHIIGNMYFLVMFGNNVEDILTWKLFAPAYLICGLAATLTHYFLTSTPNSPCIGASGAISGIMGIYLVFYPMASFYISVGMGSSSGKIKSNAIVAVGIWFIMQFVFYMFAQANKESSDNIAYMAHVGGFAAGYILGWIFKFTSIDERYYNLNGIKRANMMKQNEKSLLEDEESDKTLFNAENSTGNKEWHSLGKNEYCCQYCGEVLILNKNEIRHKSYVCAVCGKTNNKLIKEKKQKTPETETGMHK